MTPIETPPVDEFDAEPVTRIDEHAALRMKALVYGPKAALAKDGAGAR